MTELASPTTRSFTEPLAEWAEKRIRLDGRPFSFEGHEYLREIYNDTSRHIVLSKAAQIGGTTWALLRSIHACLSGLNVIYFFPTRTDVLEFSKSRVAPLLAANPFLRRQMYDTDTAGLKRIGDAYLYFKGMQSTVSLKGTPADMVVFDELDEATPEAKAMAKERVAHSDFKRVIELSNPSLPDYGVDEVYQISDQRHWWVECTECGEWTTLEGEFPRKLNEEIRILRQREDGTHCHVCAHCGAEIDVSRGEWEAEYPEREIHGYRISQLFSTKVDPGEIARDYQITRYPARFYNLKIGIPWSDLERRLDPASVLSLCGTWPMGRPTARGSCVMGVDTGKALHAVILQSVWDYVAPRYRKAGDPDIPPYRLIHAGAYREFGDLKALIDPYEIDKVVIDGLPETHATRRFAKECGCSAYLCFFSEGQTGGPAWDRRGKKVLVNRTEALDASRAVIREREIELPRQDPVVEEFARHLSCDAKVLDEDEETGIKRYRYVRTGENHYSMAFTYACMAASPGRRVLLA